MKVEFKCNSLKDAQELEDTIKKCTDLDCTVACYAKDTYTIIIVSKS